MTTNKKYIKGIFSLLIVGSLFSITFADTTSKQGRDILNQLKSEGRTDADIKSTMEDLGLDTSGYFPDTKNNATSSSSNSSNSSTTTQNSNSSNNKTSKQGRDILNQLKSEGRTDADIKSTMEDLGLDTSGYFPDTKKNTTNTTSNSSNSSTTTQNSNSSNNKTSKQGRDILNQLKSEGRTDADIKSTMEDLGLDTSGYFPDTKNNATSSSSNSSSSSSESVYTSRSCKVYNIEYEASLGVYTSRNLVKKEYFINPDYFKRYVDSKNPQISGCPVNRGWINTSYIDNSNSSTRYTAPNGKVYFITNQNGSYTSKELNTTKTFTTIDELKNYIKNRNPLISMGTQNSNNTQNNLPVNNNSNNSTDNAISKIWNEIFS